MSAVWIVVTCVGAGTFALKAAGPALLAGRQLPRRAAGLVALLAPALLGALVVTQGVGGEHRLVFDARLPGLALAALALRLRVPLLGVVVLAAATTALVRAI